jgi:hypothetical protein
VKQKKVIKVIIDITLIESLDRRTALQLVDKVNELYANPDAVELIGDFKCISRAQHEYISRIPTMYKRLKFYILERLANHAHDRISVENKFII